MALHEVWQIGVQELEEGMNDIQLAAINMGVGPPLFPTLAYLTCENCKGRIVERAEETEEGYWLCETCAYAAEEGQS